jgi:hypothetical protein
MVIDVHGHIGRISPDRREFVDVTNLIAKMDAWDIDVTCILPLSEHPEGAYLESDTEDIIAACARYPGRLIPCWRSTRRGAAKASASFFRSWISTTRAASTCTSRRVGSGFRCSST